MDKKSFDSYIKQGYTNIPLLREVLADLDTPLSVYLKLANGPYSYLFESVQGGEKWGRYSFIGLPCSTIVKVHGYHVQLERKGKLEFDDTVEDPLAWVDAFRYQFKIPELANLPRFNGGLVGYFGHDTARYIEPKLGACPNQDELQMADILLMLSDELIVFDNLLGKIQLIVHAEPSDQGYDNAQKRLDELVNLLSQSPQPLPEAKQKTIKESDFVSGFTKEGYQSAVERAKQYIADGDVMQVVLSQRTSVPFQAPPLNLYRAMRTMNPSPYMYFLDLKDSQIIGSSPEILVRLEDNEITVRPLAGTRKRGADNAEDIALEKELLSDPKELAEHLMLIDLGRNDIGRVSKVGSVNVSQRMQIERYSHVMHIVSNVVGTLKEDMSPLDVLRATFPAGTLSGAPKIRAMEIIDELEPVKRGVYGGAIGYIDWCGNMDTAIAIRTAIIKEGKLTMQAGAGIVYDSVSELEWEETINKSRIVFKAAAKASAGLKNA